uniref:Oxysterol-binding protein n=1 Tax=Laticauda laticaudata TaxID=8630 RepID=A0A8C5SR08_LATLA
WDSTGYPQFMTTIEPNISITIVSNTSFSSFILFSKHLISLFFSYRHREAYTWTNPTCCVHNVIIGKLWIEQYGTVEIINHSTGDKCILNFKPCGLFGKELHRIEGYIQDKNKKKLSVIYGKWTECLWCIDPYSYENYKKNERKGGDQKKPKPRDEPENDEADDMPEIQETVQVIPGSKLLWRISSRPSNSSQMYNFTSFTVTLNELEKGMEDILAPTDCRLRPDIRHMENGEIDVMSYPLLSIPRIWFGPLKDPS